MYHRMLSVLNGTDFSFMNLWQEKYITYHEHENRKNMNFYLSLVFRIFSDLSKANSYVLYTI